MLKEIKLLYRSSDQPWHKSLLICTFIGSHSRLSFLMTKLCIVDLFYTEDKVDVSLCQTVYFESARLYTTFGMKFVHFMPNKRNIHVCSKARACRRIYFKGPYILNRKRNLTL